MSLTVLLLDGLATALAILVLIVIDAGGLVLEPLGMRLSIQTPTRALILLGVIGLVRVLFARGHGPYGVHPDRWRQFLLLPRGAEHFRTSTDAGAGRRAAAAAAGIGLALVLLLHQQVSHPFSVPDYGDPLFSIWRMGWIVHALWTSPARILDGNIFYPVPLTLTLSDPIVLPALIGAPLRALGLHPVLTYNVLFLSAFLLSGVATYLLVERLTGSARAAFVAGLIYATYSYRLDHYSHLELQMTFWMPLGLLALHLFVSTGRLQWALGLALTIVAQLYSGMYYAVFFVLCAAVVGAGLLLAQRRPLAPLVLPLGAAALLAGTLAAPLVSAFLAAQPMKGERPLEEVALYSARPSDYLRASSRSATWKDVLPNGSYERALFPGAAPLTLAAIGLAPPFGAMRLVYAAALAVTVDGSLGVNGLLYPHLYHWLAPVRGLRSPARFGALVGLVLAVFAGFGVARLLARLGSGWRARVVLAVVIGGILIDARPSLSLVPVWPQPPPLYESIRNRPGVVLAEFPVRSDPAFNAAFMYFSLWHWTPTVNGYSGFIPKSYHDISQDLQDFPIGRSVAVLQRAGVTHVTVNCGLQWIGTDDCQTILSRVKQTPQLRQVLQREWEGAPVVLYELSPTP